MVSFRLFKGYFKRIANSKGKLIGKSCYTDPSFQEKANKLDMPTFINFPPNKHPYLN